MRLNLILVPVLFAAIGCGESSKTNLSADQSSQSVLAPAAPAGPEVLNCDIKGGAGVQLTPVFQSTAEQCESRCQEFSYSNPNRSCLFGVADVALRQHCDIKGGAGAQLATLFIGTRGECDRSCATFDQTNPNRRCMWGNIDIAPQAICDIKGGAGVQLAPVMQITRGSCSAICDQFAVPNPNRNCLWNGSKIN